MRLVTRHTLQYIQPDRKVGRTAYPVVTCWSPEVTSQLAVWKLKRHSFLSLFVPGFHLLIPCLNTSLHKHNSQTHGRHMLWKWLYLIRQPLCRTNEAVTLYKAFFFTFFLFVSFLTWFYWLIHYTFPACIALSDTCRHRFTTRPSLIDEHTKRIVRINQVR